ncbi:MAG: DEAD/DEAH box helicase family protein [Cryomorphaceae bacterium]|nr:DEAD/DEAH box helicase family protein [Cryomorphaceae bacterium]
MEKISIDKKNEVHMLVQSEPGIEREISEYFTFFIPGYRFMPSFKNKMWDGKIRLYNLRSKELYIGLLNHLLRFTRDRQYKIEYKSFPKSLNNYNNEDYEKFVKSLVLDIRARDYQIDAFLYAINHERCLLLSPTASGKSFIIYLLLRYYQQKFPNFKALIIVPTTSLVAQMTSDFADYSKPDNWNASENVHQIYAGKDKISSKPIYISTWQSLYKMNISYYADFDFILGDEAHLFKAKSLTSIMEKTINTKYKFGTTGTLDGTLTHKLVLEGLFGETHLVTTTNELIDKKTLSPFRIKSLVLQYPEEMRKQIKSYTYKEEIDVIISNEKRNKFIRNLAISLNTNTLILFQMVENHGKILYDLIKEKAKDGRKVFFVYGGTETTDRENIRKAVENETNAIVVASYGTFSTGINITNLHNIIFASPSKSRIRNLQSIGRSLRQNKSKKIATLYDIADDFSYKNYKNYTLNHFVERIKLYNEEQFEYTIITVPINS